MEINQAAEILSDYLNTHKPIKQEYSAEQIADLMNRQIDMRLQAFGSDDEPSVQPEQLRADLELMRSNLSDIQGILDDVETKLLKVGLEIDDVNENLTNSFRKLEQYRDAVREDIEKAESFLDVNQTREVAGAYDQAEREEEQEKHEQIMDAARIEDNERMISISVYKDSTGLYTEEEIQDDNLVDLYFPESIVADYVGSNEGWTHDDLLEHKLRLLFLPNYTADDTVGLVDFAKERGFEVSKQLPAEYILRQLDSSDMSLTDYVTENYSAAVSVMEHGGSLYDLDSMIAMKEALGRDITYDEFSKVNGTDIFDDMGLYNITKNEVPLVEAILSDKVHTIEEARIWEVDGADVETAMAGRLCDLEDNLDWRKELKLSGNGEEITGSGKAALLDSFHNMTAKQEKLTVSVSSKLVGEPFKAKDGNFYVRVKLPNENKADKSPWGSIVVKPEQVTENKVTGKTDISLNANGTVTIFKPEVVCYNQVNQPEYVNRKIKISTADLKKRFTRTEPKNIKNLITKNTKRKDEINQQKQQKDKQINTPVKKNSIGRD